MKFKVREKTDFLYLVYSDTGGLSATELHRQARRAAKFGIDVHYVVQRSGLVETGREPYAIAGGSLENSKISVYALVDVGEKGKVSDAQKVAIKDLQDSLKGTYPNIKVKKLK